MLTLPIKKKWFDMIKSGEKKEEYREIKPYYNSRFYAKSLSENSRVMLIRFRNGYSKNSPSIVCRCYIYQDFGKPEWGAEVNKQYWVLKILRLERTGE